MPLHKRSSDSLPFWQAISVALVTAVLTVTLGEFFKSVSWTQTFLMQEANEAVSAAIKTNKEAIELIAKRRYGSYRYLDALANLYSKKKSSNNWIESIDSKLQAQRAEAYFQNNKEWTEQYSRILSDIDFSIDRPLGISEAIHQIELSKFDCKQPIIAGMKKVGLQHQSLKLQFAVIDRCFRSVRRGIDNLRRVLRQKGERTDVDFNYFYRKKDRLQGEGLGDIYTHENVFRCFLRARIEYLKKIRGNLLNQTILLRIWRVLNPPSAMFFSDVRSHADEHFKDTETHACRISENATLSP